MGYGDFAANSYVEQLISIVVMGVGVMFFSLTIGTLTSLISDMDTKSIAYEKQIGILLKIQ